MNNKLRKKINKEMKYSSVFKSFELSWYTKNSLKTFMRKLGSTFGFVIILMPVFGVILSIGNLLNTYNAPKVLSNLFTNIGTLLFTNIGLWFAIALTIGFTNNKGVAVYSSIIFYFAFTLTMAAFIQTKNTNNNTFDILFWKNLEQKIYLTSIFGFLTFNTGVIGGFLSGAITTLIYNRFKETKLIVGLEFFSKEKFVLVLIPFVAILFAILWLIFWPSIGYSLRFLGMGLANSPTGLDSFIFATVSRFLTPFGAGMLIHSPLWYTELGGSLRNYEGQLFAQYLLRTQPGNISWLSEFVDMLMSQKPGSWAQTSVEDFINASNLTSDAKKEIISLLSNWHYNVGDYQGSAINLLDLRGDQVIAANVINNNYITMQDCWNVGLRVSRFIAAGFANSIFVLPAIGLAIFLQIDKKDRKKYIGSFIIAFASSALLGITEPLEYMFCYICPIFYFGVYSPMLGIIGAISSIAQLKLGTTFSTGLFDLIFNGAIPTIAGQNTRIWLVPILGVIFGVIEFTMAYFYFKYTKFDPFEKYLSKKDTIKANINELKLNLYSYKNIKNIKVEDNKLILITNKPINIEFIEKWFSNVKFNSDCEYKMTIKKEFQETIEVLFESLKESNNLSKFKKEDKKAFLTCKKDYKRYKKSLKKIPIN
ncbi:PTS system, glucose-specific IIBC component [Spiroplasma gladiatoris]|uniref:PTS system, glucose-specific IIBC component n=1 Tax=Spiroplasma gladiatoris TaxID=2143 RepID=A0A4P7AJ46_9MOLU|nr:PTS transporter subunit EIIC [Spiroplasma gladiatoris]QBQ07676.1 PTS system, glucose-specific IIBC component [Spiroplasma gladiatoris]